MLKCFQQRPSSHAGGGLKTWHVHAPREHEHFTPLERGAVQCSLAQSSKQKKGVEGVTICPRFSVGAKPALHAPAAGSSPVLAFLPLPTAHCPLPIAHCPPAHCSLSADPPDRSGKLGKVESNVRQLDAKTPSRPSTGVSQLTPKCEHTGAQHCGPRWGTVMPAASCLACSKIISVTAVCGTAKLSISPFLHVFPEPGAPRLIGCTCRPGATRWRWLTPRC